MTLSITMQGFSVADFLASIQKQSDTEVDQVQKKAKQK